MRIVTLWCLEPGQEIVGPGVVFRSPRAESREAKLLRLRIALALYRPSPQRSRP